MIRDPRALAAALIGTMLIVAFSLGRRAERESIDTAQAPRQISRFAPAQSEPPPEHELLPGQGFSQPQPESESPENSYNPYSDEILRDGLISVFGEEGSAERQERLRIYREAKLNKYREQASVSQQGFDFTAAFAGVNAATAAVERQRTGSAEGAVNPYLALAPQEPRVPTYFENAARSRGGQ